MKVFIKCDHPGCGYREFVPEISPKHIGKRCPNDGSIMLTQSDYDQWVSLMKILKPLMWISDAILFIARLFGHEPKVDHFSLGREDLRPGETYSDAFARKLKERAEKNKQEKVNG